MQKCDLSSADNEYSSARFIPITLQFLVIWTKGLRPTWAYRYHPMGSYKCVIKFLLQCLVEDESVEVLKPISLKIELRKVLKNNFYRKMFQNSFSNEWMGIELKKISKSAAAALTGVGSKPVTFFHVCLKLFLFCLTFVESWRWNQSKLFL